MTTEYIAAEEDLITFGKSAALKVKELLEDEENKNLKFRAYIIGGGCSGFQYGFQFDEEAREDDIQVEEEGVTLLVDSMSFMYLQGAVVEFKNDLIGSQFTINNPNAKSTCGCGSSFSI